MAETKMEKPRIAAMERGPGPGRYTLPNLTGYQAHDVSRKLHPAYSFGLRLGTSFIKKQIGPGPAYLIDPMMTRYGRDGTAQYSLHSRHKELEPFKTPGPGAHCPEKFADPSRHRPPAYSMGGRTRYRKRDANPSPASYTLPSMLGDKVPNRTSSACYSMAPRSKLGGFDTDYAKTPGPARYNTTSAEITQRKAPNYSMQSRNYMPTDATRIPGPGAHCPERVTLNRRAAPAYSLGVKHSEYICPLVIDTPDD
ncbi:PREDICTED: outer dense fiber protein 3-B-like [Amphimedon queenslandica]|uniref:Outer dense fiber protein 3-like protein 2 n=1 Tax=Amphimedon queenslandica TaxID=400682 RepID=I1F3X5_AMPQE|nr:PREDICTED: outer dense fiber protein 3-B-like [Amphimedon queenslandica]XP_003390964.1 PREDICTED: outer dense fiber protein 3-B-like [Amphimedon queenslandica]|eukprot:XP_003389790.1 PREDICTED: outer dense fiber protein 3-B-like [Amphimedon queenslandica]